GSAPGAGSGWRWVTAEVSHVPLPGKRPPGAALGTRRRAAPKGGPFPASGNRVAVLPVQVDRDVDEPEAGDAGEGALARHARPDAHRKDLLLAVHREVRLAAELQRRPAVGTGVALRLVELVERRRRGVDDGALHRTAARRGDVDAEHERLR